eukprot:jgi/Mesvir1/16262/Mv08508-RA.1
MLPLVPRRHLAGAAATIGSALMRISPIPGWCREQQASLSVLQEARLHQLQQSVVIPFDAENEEHEEALRALWRHAFPGEPLQDLVTPEWTRMGWQGPNPGTDFRGAGFLSLHNLVALAERYPDDFASLLHKTKGTRAKMEYPFAVAGLNLTFMLLTLLGLHRDKLHNRSEGAWRGFVRLLEVEERAFDELYRLTFLLLDRLWLVFEADYMDFQMVLAATRSRLEQVLSSPNITCIADVHTGLFANIEEIQRPMQRRR